MRYGDDEMEKKFLKGAVFAAAMAYLFTASACGRTVPPASGGAEQTTEMKVAGGAVTAASGTTASTASKTETTTAAGVEIGDKHVSGLTLSYTSADIIVGQTLKYPLVSEDVPEVWTSSNESIATVDSVGNITGKSEGSCIVRVVSSEDTSLGAEVKVTVKKAEGTQQIDGITYIDGILVANKSYPVPQSYAPGGLTSETYNAFQELANDAAAEGLTMGVISGYRSYDYQSELYNNYVNTYGQAAADTFSARPGYSEHQTGLAIDVNCADDSFTGTPEAAWLAAHCNDYGFILRYPQGKEGVTGYKYESWHIRYVGKDVAKKIREAANAAGDPDLTLEEYLHIDSYYH